ncbi:hypothetical protein [Desulfonatronum thioautotrophicum]|uniref:hypothetical protein n=1 Tax=Desulfonatronum thioautotrophicum TaxID=617001 RepID=UPI0005EB658D|nr:hypothetical protein [Desulfonatronum thioautotrophicum]
MARKLSKLEKFGLIGAVITASLFFYLKHVYDPQQAAFTQAQEQLNRTIREFNQLQAAEPPFQLRRRLESEREQLKEVKEELEALDVRFGTEEDLIRNQHWVFRQMERLNMRILSAQPLRTQEDLFTWHVYRVSLEGDFKGFTQFLHELRNHTTPLRVHNVSISGDVKGWPLRISMELWI